MAGHAGHRARRRQEIRDQLLTLIESTLDDGAHFTDISVEYLTASAGMSRTRFYHYFEDKNDLLRAWFAQISTELSAVGDTWWSASAPVSKRALTATLARMARTYRPHATLMAALEAAAAADPALRAALMEAVQLDARALREHIHRGQVSAAIDPGLDADAIADWLTMLSWRGRQHLIRRADDAELDRMVGAQCALVWNVLYAGSSAVRQAGRAAH